MPVWHSVSVAWRLQCLGHSISDKKAAGPSVPEATPLPPSEPRPPPVLPEATPSTGAVSPGLGLPPNEAPPPPVLGAATASTRAASPGIVLVPPRAVTPPPSDSELDLPVNWRDIEASAPLDDGAVSHVVHEDERTPPVDHRDPALLSFFQRSGDEPLTSDEILKLAQKATANTKLEHRWLLDWDYKHYTYKEFCTYYGERGLARTWPCTSCTTSRTLRRRMPRIIQQSKVCDRR